MRWGSAPRLPPCCSCAFASRVASCWGGPFFLPKRPTWAVLLLEPRLQAAAFAKLNFYT